MLEQLFEKINSELLTDEVKLEMNAIFESAVNDAIKKKEEALDESNRKEIAEFKDELVTKLDEYLTYFVEEFTRENEQQIDDAVKIKTAKRVLSVFEGIVNEFNIQLAEKTETDADALDQAKATISEQTEEILKLRKEIQTAKAEKIVEGKAQTFEIDSQREKFKQLAETVSFTTDEEYGKKLDVLAETVKETGKVDPPKQLSEDLDVQPPKEVDPRMQKYLARL